MIGFTALISAFVFTLISAISYGMACLPKQQARQKGKGGSLFYNISFGFIIIAFIYLYYLILADQFQYRYVYNYSSSDLPLLYKISAFWAGQEGSFLLWVILHSLFGFILKHSKAVKPMLTAVMTVYSLLQAGLIIILLVQSPFMVYVQIPPEGNGLNPLLQNPWMAFHPPVLFLGYAALAVPFAWAIGSLITKDFAYWVRPALKWILFGWAMLGMGIYMGAFWAYEVLGWGGYWAWDPVENSSLIPWLIAGAAVHFLLVGQRRIAAIKPSYLTVIFAYSTALYGTFLTRSGILSDFSTHSFASQGIGTQLAWLFMVVLAAALVFLIIRWPSLPVADEEPIKSRAYMTMAGAIAICALALIVLFGTSYPLISSVLGNPHNVAASFYNQASLPLAGCILILIIFASILNWKKTDHPVSKKDILFVLAGVIVAALGFVYRIHNHVMVMIVLALSGAAFMATLIGLKKGLSKPAVLTHSGLCALIIGVIISSAASQTEIATFASGQELSFFGKTFTYIGTEYVSDEDGNEKGYVEKFTMDGKQMDAKTNYDKAGLMSAHQPSVSRGLLSDIYLAPADQHGTDDTYELVKETPVSLALENMEMTLIDYGMTSEDSDTTGVFAEIDVIKDGKTQLLRVELVQTDGNFESVPVTIFDQYTVNLLAVSTTENKIMLDVHNIDLPTEQIVAEISKKPLINLVWVGMILLSIGTVWAAKKHKGPVLRS